MRKRSLKRFILLFLFGFGFYFSLLTIIIYTESFDEKSLIEDYADAVWYSVVTFTTVGYGDYYPITFYGRITGYIFIILGVAFYGLIIAEITNAVARFQRYRKLGYKGTNMKDHAIVIGWDDFGRGVVDQLVHAKRKVAIVTNIKDNIDLIYEIYDSKYVFALYCDLMNLDMLKKVNPQDSAVVFINIEDDTKKLVYALNLRKTFGDLMFVVTIENANLKSTFLSAGIRYTVSKNEISSKLLASYLFEPDVALFSEDIMSFAEEEMDHDIKEFKVLENNPYVDKTYNHAFSDLKKTSNAVLIGMAKIENGERVLYKNPEQDLLIEAGDYLIVLTNMKAYKKLSREFGVEEGVFKKDYF